MDISVKIFCAGQARRFRLTQDLSLSAVKLAIRSQFADLLASVDGVGAAAHDFGLFYFDDENDEIFIGSDLELQEAVQVRGQDRCLTLHVKKSLDSNRSNQPSPMDIEEKSLLNYVSPHISSPPSPNPSPQPSTTEQNETTAVSPVSSSDEVPSSSSSSSSSSPSSPPETVPLSDLIDPEVTDHPFFLTLRDNFLEFVHNVRSSVPPQFPDQLASHFSSSCQQVQDSVDVFVGNLRSGQEPVLVPAAWKTNSFVVMVRDSIQDTRESIQVRMDRWNTARSKLQELGFSEYAFIQQLLIIQHDGNVELVVDDLLVRSGQVERLQTTFGRLSDTIRHLFHVFGEAVRARGSAAIQRTASAVQHLNQQVNAGIAAGAVLVDQHVAANRDAAVQHLQSELDKNVRAFHEQVHRLNDAGASLGTQVNERYEHSLALFNQAVTRSNDLMMTLHAQANTAGAAVSQNTLHMLAESIHNLGALLIQASQNVEVTSKSIASSSSSSSSSDAAVASSSDDSKSPDVIEMNEFEVLPLPAAPEPAPVVVVEVDPKEKQILSALQTLKEMGFADEDQLRQLLLAHDLNVDEVVGLLLPNNN